MRAGVALGDVLGMLGDPPVPRARRVRARVS
jgi:hypothetical protein